MATTPPPMTVYVPLLGFTGSAQNVAFARAGSVSKRNILFKYARWSTPPLPMYYRLSRV